MSYDNLRNLINDNYYNIRPVLSEAVNSAIRSAEENGEEEVVPQLSILINAFADNEINDAIAIDNYFSSVNRNSVTRQFFERFVAQVQAPVPPPPPQPLQEQFARVDAFLRMFPSRNRENREN